MPVAAVEDGSPILLNGGAIMPNEVICIFKRNSKCIFKGGLCDQDCDKADREENHRSHENLLKECLEGGNWKLVFSKKALSLLLHFP